MKRRDFLKASLASFLMLSTSFDPASVAWVTGIKDVNRTFSVLTDGRKLKTIFELAKEKEIRTAPNYV